MDQRLLFSSLSLEFVVAFWVFPVTFLGAIVDSSGQLWLYLAEASIVLTAVSLVAAVFGLLRVGTLTVANSQVLIVISVIAVFGTIASSWWILGVGSWASMDCGSLTVWKCNVAQAGTYVGYYFFPAIAVPIVTLIFGMGNLAMIERSHSKAGLASGIQ